MRLILLFCLFALSPLLFAADSRRLEEIWVPMKERGKIWDEVVSNNEK